MFETILRFTWSRIRLVPNHIKTPSPLLTKKLIERTLNAKSNKLIPRKGQRRKKSKLWKLAESRKHQGGKRHQFRDIGWLPGSTVTAFLPAFYMSHGHTWRTEYHSIIWQVWSNQIFNQLSVPFIPLGSRPLWGGGHSSPFRSPRKSWWQGLSAGDGIFSILLFNKHNDKHNKIYHSPRMRDRPDRKGQQKKTKNTTQYHAVKKTNGQQAELQCFVASNCDWARKVDLENRWKPWLSDDASADPAVLKGCSGGKYQNSHAKVKRAYMHSSVSHAE